MKLFEIPIRKTGRFFALGTPGENIQRIWLVCHGYGQLAEFFLRKFKGLDDGSNLIIAPEGPHRFYVQGFSGRVGASWMTKEERETDIQDYTSYLDQVLENLPQFDHPTRLIVLGFSQGTHTVCRWVCRNKVPANNLVLWGGTVPDDLNSEEEIPFLNSIDPKIWIGKKDKFIDQAHLKERIRIMDKKGLSYQLIRYEGGHDIEAEALHRLYKTIK